MTLKLSELIKPTARQRDFLKAADAYKYILYGGAAGGGKSYILRWWCLLVALKAFALHKVPNVKVGLFCENYPSLIDRQISKMATEFPRALGEIKKTQTEGLVFKLKPELGGGMILPRNLDEPAKYDSVEFCAIAVDELTKNQLAVFHELRKRLRWPGFPEGYNFPFAAGSNPGGPGHAWVKRFWVEQPRDLPPELKGFEHLFAFIPAKAQDNPHNPASYYADLLTLPEDMRRAYAEGDWDMFAGQYFKEWRKEIHVIEPREIPEFWMKWWASDWGYTAPWVSGWYARHPDGHQVYRYRELVMKETDPEPYAKKCIEMTGSEKLRYRVLDPSCWNASTGPSIAERLNGAGWTCIKAENDRVNGWSRVREYLAWERSKDGTLVRHPKFYNFSTCPYLSKTIVSLVHDEHDPEDLDSDGEAHAADELRYSLMTRPPATIIPLDELPQEYAEAHARAAKWEEMARVR